MFDLLKKLEFERFPKQSRQIFFNEMKEHIQREYDDSTHTATLEKWMPTKVKNLEPSTLCLMPGMDGEQIPKTQVLWQLEKSTVMSACDQTR